MCIRDSCRILDVFLIIDKQNKKHIIRARYILQKMLHKSGYKNIIVRKILSMKGSEFSQHLSRISQYVLTYNDLVNAACSKNESKIQPSLQSAANTANKIETDTFHKNTVEVSNITPNLSHTHEDVYKRQA